MVIQGRVQNGVIVLAEGVRLEEGQEVTVIAPPKVRTEPHSVLDILPVSLGPILLPLQSEEDLLGEMLEGRQ